MAKNGMRPVHPGEILREDFLKPAGLSVNALAKALHVPAPRINGIVLERRGITADTAMRLARYFGGEFDNDENVQHSKRARHRHEEVTRLDGPRVILKERGPSLIASGSIRQPSR